MRLLADENVPLAAVQALRGAGHDVLSVQESTRGAGDEVVLDMAGRTGRILITLDKDFGELAFRRGLPMQCGVLLVRFAAETPQVLAHRIINVLHSQASWIGVFASVDEDRVRIRSMPSASD